MEQVYSGICETALLPLVECKMQLIDGKSPLVQVADSILLPKVSGVDLLSGGLPGA